MPWVFFTYFKTGGKIKLHYKLVNYEIRKGA